MKKNVKKVTLATTFLVGAAALAIGAVGVKPNVTTAQATTGEPFVAAATDFFMEEGASVRTETNPGIRFAAHISDEYVAQLGTLNTDYTIGMAIIPQSAANNIENFDETKMDEYVSEAGVQMKPVLNYVPENSAAYTKYGKEGYNLFMMSLVQIPETKEFWETEIIANAYIEVDGAYTFVTDFTDNQAQKEDIAHVSAEALAAGEEGDILDQIIGEIAEGVAVPAPATRSQNLLIGVGATKSASLVATTTPAYYAVKWTTSSPSVATVDKTGKITGLKAGQTTVTATFGGYSQSYTVKVYNDVYEFEDVNDANNVVEQGNKSGSLYIGNTDTELKTEENVNSLIWQNAGATSYPILYFQQDYLEYAFSDPSVAYIEMDTYLTCLGKRNTDESYTECTSTHNYDLITLNQTQTTYNKKIIHKPTDTLEKLRITRTVYEMMVASGEYQIRIDLGNASLHTNKMHIDNVTAVKYQDVYDFEDGVNPDLIWRVLAGTSTRSSYLKGITEYGSNVTDSLGLGTQGLQYYNQANWPHFGISRSYLEWVFKVKGAVSFSFDIYSDNYSGDISTNGTISSGNFTVSQRKTSPGTKATFTLTKAGYEEAVAEWESNTKLSETYAEMVAAQRATFQEDFDTNGTVTYNSTTYNTVDEAVAAYEENSSTYKLLEKCMNNQMLFYFQIGYLKDGKNNATGDTGITETGLFYVDNFKVNMPA